MRHYKFIHILYSDGLKINSDVVEVINDRKNGFDPEDHLFVTPYEDVFNSLSSYSNVELSTVASGQSAGIANFYAKYADWLILHSGIPFKQVLLLKKSTAGKIIWRTWGHDVWVYKKSGSFVKRLFLSCANKLYRKKISQFRCIGIANVADEIALKRNFDKLPELTVLPYPRHTGIDDILSYQDDRRAPDDDICRVLLGHSGFSYDNHINVIKKLEKYSDSAVEIIIPLSYGSPGYISEVEEYISNCVLKDKITVLKDFVPFSDYTKILQKTDVAIFDGVKACALGNISVLLLFRKKFFLNSAGALAETFDRERVPYHKTEDIDKMSFAEFSAAEPYETNTNLLPKSYEERVAVLQKLLCSLENEKLKG